MTKAVKLALILALATATTTPARAESVAQTIIRQETQRVYDAYQNNPAQQYKQSFMHCEGDISAPLRAAIAQKLGPDFSVQVHSEPNAVEVCCQFAQITCYVPRLVLGLLGQSVATIATCGEEDFDCLPEEPCGEATCMTTTIEVFSRSDCNTSTSDCP